MGSPLTMYEELLISNHTFELVSRYLLALRAVHYERQAGAYGRQLKSALPRTAISHLEVHLATSTSLPTETYLPFENEMGHSTVRASK